MKNYTQIINESFDRKYLKESSIQHNENSTTYILDGTLISYEDINNEINKLELEDNNSHIFNSNEVPNIYTSQEEVDEDVNNGNIKYINNTTIITVSSLDKNGNAAFTI